MSITDDAALVHPPSMRNLSFPYDEPPVSFSHLYCRCPSDLIRDLTHDLALMQFRTLTKSCKKEVMTRW